MGARDIVVIGASSGGVVAVSKLVAALPGDLPAAVFVVVHVAPTTPSVLPQILERFGPMTASHAIDGEAIRNGHIYVAPPDRHLLVLDSAVGVTAGPRENMHRPAVDVLFRSAATVYGPRVVGVILTGALDDGTAGLWAVKTRGGHTIVQDPDDAFVASMPASAVDVVHPDEVLPLAAIAAAVTRAVTQGTSAPRAVPGQLDPESEIQRRGAGTMDDRPPGTPSEIACPECLGSLREMDDGSGVTRFRCHTGHAFSPESLFATQNEDLERALWGALRALDESATLARRLAARHEQANRAALALRYQERARVTEGNAETLRQLLRSRADAVRAVD